MKKIDYLAEVRSWLNEDIDIKDKSKDDILDELIITYGTIKEEQIKLDLKGTKFNEITQTLLDEFFRLKIIPQTNSLEYKEEILKEIRAWFKSQERSMISNVKANVILKFGKIPEIIKKIKVKK